MSDRPLINIEVSVDQQELTRMVRVLDPKTIDKLLENIERLTSRFTKTLLRLQTSYVEQARVATQGKVVQLRRIKAKD